MDSLPEFGDDDLRRGGAETNAMLPRFQQGTNTLIFFWGTIKDMLFIDFRLYSSYTFHL
jgi:hypothetical protein